MYFSTEIFSKDVLVCSLISGMPSFLNSRSNHYNYVIILILCHVGIRFLIIAEMSMRLERVTLKDKMQREGAENKQEYPRHSNETIVDTEIQEES
jgi:hypothetical protein